MLINAKRVVRWQRWAALLCVAAAAPAGIALAGPMLDEPRLTTLLPGGAETQPGSAWALLATAAAIWLQLRAGALSSEAVGRYRQASLGMAGAALALAAIGWIESFFLIDTGLNALLAPGSSPLTGSSGSSLAAVGVLAIGTAALLLHWRRTIAASQMLACGVGILAWASIAATLYNIEALRLNYVNLGIGLPTVLGWLMLAGAIVLAQPDRGLTAVFSSATAGGTLARQLLIPVALLPVLVNWVELMGERFAWYPEGIGWVIDAVVTVVGVGGLVSWAAVRLHRTDAERLTAIEALDESEERYRRLLETSPDAVLIKDRHRIQLANAAALELLGTADASEIAGRSPYAFVPAADRPQIEAKLCSLLDTGGRFPATEQQILRLDGTPVDVELTASVVEVRGQRLAQVIARDITERKRQDRALRAHESRLKLSEQRFRATFEQAAVGMSHLSPDGAFTRVNPRLCEILASPADGLLRRSFEELVHPDDRMTGLRQREQLLAGDLTTSTIQIRHLRGDGSTIWVESTMSIVREFEQGAWYFLVVTQDINERHALQEQLLRAQKMETIGQLAGGLAHDFNNLLTIVHAHTSFLLEDDRIPAEHRSAARDVVAAADRATALTRKLLLVGRRQVMQPTRLNLNATFAELEPVLSRLIPEHIHLRFDMEPGPRFVHADRAMVEQIVLNLVVNAKDAMPAGGRLTVATTHTTFGPEIAQLNLEAQPGPYAGIVVSDTGTGIDPHVMPRIFEPFFSTKQPDAGTGLGLATVFGIVKQHRGCVTVESAPGNGATFRVWLPESEAPHDDQSHAPALRAGLGAGTETILLVEDDPSVRAFTRRTLERHGYRVLQAANGQEALDIWQEHCDSIQLLITDHVMPGGLSGRDLALRLKRDAPALKVILTSGYSVDLAGTSLQLAPDETFIDKPFTPARLAEAVRQALDRRS